MTTAYRETTEEVLLDLDAAKIIGTYVDEHGGWSYTTVLARVDKAISATLRNAESTAVHWWAIDEISSLQLHPGFAATWPNLRVQLSAPISA